MTFVSLLDIIYPVGSLYFNYENKSPADTFGGSWVQITGRVLRMDGNVNTGGADTHNHGLDAASGSNSKALLNIQAADMHYFRVAGGGFQSNKKLIYGSAGTQQDAALPHGDAIGLGGSTATVSTLPAYQNIYTWRRTA